MLRRRRRRAGRVAGCGAPGRRLGRGSGRRAGASGDADGRPGGAARTRAERARDAGARAGCHTRRSRSRSRSPRERPSRRSSRPGAGSAECAEGRAMACAEVCRAISDGDRRVLRGRRVRAHLRDCASCAAFASAIEARQSELRALVPVLPAAASAGGAVAGDGLGHRWCGRAAVRSARRWPRSGGAAAASPRARPLGVAIGIKGVRHRVAARDRGGQRRRRRGGCAARSSRRPAWSHSAPVAHAPWPTPVHHATARARSSMRARRLRAVRGPARGRIATSGSSTRTRTVGRSRGIGRWLPGRGSGVAALVVGSTAAGARTAGARRRVMDTGPCRASATTRWSATPASPATAITPGAVDEVGRWPRWERRPRRRRGQGTAGGEGSPRGRAVGHDK